MLFFFLRQFTNMLLQEKRAVLPDNLPVAAADVEITAPLNRLPQKLSFSYYNNSKS